MAQPQDDDEYLTVPEVAAELRYSDQTVRNWIKSGKLKAMQPTVREYRIRRSDLDAMLAREASIAPNSSGRKPLRAARTSLIDRIHPIDETGER